MTGCTDDLAATSPLVSDHLFTADAGALRGTKCLECAELSFPTRQICPGCGRERVTDVALPRRGTVWTFTVVHATPPGYEGPCPYMLGVVELDGALRITSLITADDLDEVRIGDEVWFELVELGSGPHSVTTFGYRRQGGTT
jgi:hypothetical protein